MAAVLANENVPLASVEALREAGHQIIAVAEIMPGATDTEVLARAKADGLILLTLDRDYGALIYSSGLPAPRAVLYLRRALASPVRAAELAIPWLQHPDEIVGSFMVVTPEAARRRPLPR